MAHTNSRSTVVVGTFSTLLVFVVSMTCLAGTSVSTPAADVSALTLACVISGFFSFLCLMLMSTTYIVDGVEKDEHEEGEKVEIISSSPVPKVLTSSHLRLVPSPPPLENKYDDIEDL